MNPSNNQPPTIGGGNTRRRTIMEKMTSACASKMLRKLEEDKLYWLGKEADGSTYIAATDEEPVIPDYDYATVAQKIAEIDAKVVILKHSINVNNVRNRIDVGGREMTIDEILVVMAQLNKRKFILDRMRKNEPMHRINSAYMPRKAAPEYQYINYDMELVESEYERIDSQISQMQMALDKYNQTFEFEVDI